MLDEISQKNLKEALDKFVPDHCCDPGVTIKPTEPTKNGAAIFLSHVDFRNNATVNGTDMAEFIKFVNRAIPILDTMMREQNERLKNLQSASEELDKAIKALERRIEDLETSLVELGKVEVQPNVIHIHYDRPTPCPTFPMNPWYDPYRPYCTSSSTSNADNLSKTTATMTTGGVVSDKVASNFVKFPVKVEDRADLSDMSNPRDQYSAEQKERDELIKSIILTMVGSKHE